MMIKYVYIFQLNYIPKAIINLHQNVQYKSKIYNYISI